MALCFVWIYNIRRLIGRRVERIYGRDYFGDEVFVVDRLDNFSVEGS